VRNGPAVIFCATMLAAAMMYPPAARTAVISPQALAAQLPESHGAILSGSRPPSPDLAFLMSAAVPGSGQLYAGTKRGYAYLVAEAGLLVGYALTRRSAENQRDKYVQEVKAGVKFDGAGSFDSWNMEDFEHASDFENWHNIYTDDGGQPVGRVGKFYWSEEYKDYDTEQGDRIPDTPARLVALDLRLDSNDRFKSARRFVGVMLFNHLVSAIDARIAARGAAAEPVTLRLAPDGASQTRWDGPLALSAEWRRRF